MSPPTTGRFHCSFARLVLCRVLFLWALVGRYAVECPLRVVRGVPDVVWMEDDTLLCGGLLVAGHEMTGAEEARSR